MLSRIPGPKLRVQPRAGRALRPSGSTWPAVYLLLGGLLLAPASAWVRAAEQTAPPVVSSHLTYLAPVWNGMLSADDDEVAWQVARLRTRIGEGGGVKLGFSVYIVLEMRDWHVDLNSPEAVRSAMGDFEFQVDKAIRRARTHDIVLVIGLLTAIRAATDPVQRQSFEEDRRVMQWDDQNAVVDGWWTHSRYARRQYRVQRAYMQEASKILAARVAAYPETLVAIAGDGEVELAGATDYTPFAVVEFRDWLRAEGLYAPGGPFSADAYSLAPRYRGDATPGVDSNGDGHTLNADVGTQFSSWDLRYFDWSLADSEDADPHAIPQAVYAAAWFNPRPDAGPERFDPPREGQGTSSWNQLWQLFRQTMVWHHNRDLARWMTTTPDGEGRVLPADRWFSYQIPADYLWESTPEHPDPRLLSSASPWWTANVAPYGGLGFTTFGVRVGRDAYLRTLPGLLSGVTSCGTDARVPPACLGNPDGFAGATWGLFEWNPVVPLAAGHSPDSVLDSRRRAPASRTIARDTAAEVGDHRIYDDELRRLRRYRPRVLAPFLWDDPDYPILDTGFETALRDFARALRDGWTASVGISPRSLRFSARRVGASLVSLSGPQPVFLTQPTGGTVDWEATCDQPELRLASRSGHGDGAFSVELDPSAVDLLPAGTHQRQVLVSAPGSAQGTITLPVTITVADDPRTDPPFGLVDTPAHGATGVMGALGISGWVLDDTGVAWVRLYRNCMPFEPEVHCQVIDGVNVVYMGEATLVAGARPDVELLYPDYPLAHRAGWGYAMLTNLAPHVPSQQLSGGQGPLTLFVRARDVEGHEAWLGRDFVPGFRTRTDGLPTGITLANDAIAKPFGTIDLPAQGQSVSGVVGNFGWVLTPDSDTEADPEDILIQPSGSSLTLFIDGVPHARPIYNLCRGTVGSPPAANAFCDDDVSNTFGNETARPAGSRRTSNPTRFRNLDAGRGAIGGYWVDTTTLANGVHTIVWSAYDTAGRGEGLGSRYFTVLNAGTDANAGPGEQGPGARSVTTAGPTQPSPSPDARPRGFVEPGEAGTAVRVRGRIGFALDAPFEDVLPDHQGIRHVRLGEHGRLELQVGPGVRAGCLQVNDECQQLPVGSHLNLETGTFTWAPGVGFWGTYRLAFSLAVVDVTIRPEPPGEAAIRMSLDTPPSGATVHGSFVVAGWALDPEAAIGSGVGAIHVWAQRIDQAGVAPMFLGAATLSGARPDVARIFGLQFSLAGFRLEAAALPPGSYDVTAYVWSTRSRRWEDARSASIVVR